MNGWQHQRFAELWAELLKIKAPRPVHKRQAMRTFGKTITTSEHFDAMLMALRNYRKSKRVKDGYVQDASTWLNDWEQWIETPEDSSDTLGMSRELWAQMFPGVPYGQKRA